MTKEIKGVSMVPHFTEGKRTLFQHVECSRCDQVLPLRNTSSSKTLPEEAVKSMAIKFKWSWSSRGKHLCPKCQERPMKIVPKTKDTQTGTDKALRRAVWRLVDKSYNAPLERYDGDVSDESIAKEAGATVAFVAKVREDDFGQIKDNRELLEHLSKIDAAIEKADSAYLTCLKAAENADEQAKTLKSLRDAVRMAAGVSVP